MWETGLRSINSTKQAIIFFKKSQIFVQNAIIAKVLLSNKNCFFLHNLPGKCEVFD